MRLNQKQAGMNPGRKVLLWKLPLDKMFQGHMVWVERMTGDNNDRQGIHCPLEQETFVPLDSNIRLGNYRWDE